MQIRRWRRNLVKVADIFLLHTEVGHASGCWIWHGSTVSNGYGTLSVGRTKLAHRYAYETFVGPIGQGLDCCHKCDNRKCVNPWHLFLGTRRDNMRDCVAKNRQAKGEYSGRSKLTQRQIDEIRGIDGLMFKDIAKIYSVDRSSISRIKNKKTWR